MKSKAPAAKKAKRGAPKKRKTAAKKAPRRKAAKRAPKTPAASDGREHCFYRGDDGELQIIRLVDNVMVNLAGREVERLTRFLVLTPPAAELTPKRKGARR